MPFKTKVYNTLLPCVTAMHPDSQATLAYITVESDLAPLQILPAVEACASDDDPLLLKLAMIRDAVIQVRLDWLTNFPTFWGVD